MSIFHRVKQFYKLCLFSQYFFLPMLAVLLIFSILPLKKCSHYYSQIFQFQGSFVEDEDVALFRHPLPPSPYAGSSQPTPSQHNTVVISVRPITIAYIGPCACVVCTAEPHSTNWGSICRMPTPQRFVPHVCWEVNLEHCDVGLDRGRSWTGAVTAAAAGPTESSELGWPCGVTQNFRLGGSLYYHVDQSLDGGCLWGRGSTLSEGLPQADDKFQKDTTTLSANGGILTWIGVVVVDDLGITL